MALLPFTTCSLVGQASQVIQWVKNPPAMQEMPEMWVWFLGREDPLEESMATHSSILAWRIPWTEEPGGLQFGGHIESDTPEVTEHTAQRSLVGRRNPEWTPTCHTFKPPPALPASSEWREERIWSNLEKTADWLRQASQEIHKWKTRFIYLWRELVVWGRMDIWIVFSGTVLVCLAVGCLCSLCSAAHTLMWAHKHPSSPTALLWVHGSHKWEYMAKMFRKQHLRAKQSFA